MACLHTPIHSGSGRCGAGAATSSLSIRAPRITNDSPPSFAEFGVFYPPTFLVIPCVRLMAGLKISMVTPGCLGQGWTHIRYQILDGDIGGLRLQEIWAARWIALEHPPGGRTVRFRRCSVELLGAVWSQPSPLPIAMLVAMNIWSEHKFHCSARLPSAADRARSRTVVGASCESVVRLCCLFEAGCCSQLLCPGDSNNQGISGIYF